MQVGDIVQVGQIGNDYAPLTNFWVGEPYLSPVTQWFGAASGQRVFFVLSEAELLSKVDETTYPYFYFREDQLPPPGTKLVFTQREYARVVEIPKPFPTRRCVVMLCRYGQCTNNACIDSKYCLDHQPAVPKTEHSVMVAVDVGDGYKIAEEYYAKYLTSCQKESNMNGAIFTVAVVRTKTVAAGEGVTSGVQKSEVVYIKQNFTALNSDAAKGIALAEAINAVKGFDVNDPTAPIELRVQTF